MPKAKKTKAKEKPEKTPKKPEVRQSMSFREKGEIFALRDSGKTIVSIACSTGYSLNRIKWLIEACVGTSAWKEAKNKWSDYVKELDNEREARKNDRKQSRISSRKQRTNKNKRSEKKAYSGLRNLSDRTAAKTIASGRVKTGLSKRKQRSHQIRNDTSRSRSSQGNRRSGSIIRSLRKARDYKGE